MHTTDKIDFESMIAGRAVLELDDGESVEAEAGDAVVQNGRRDARRNPFSEPRRMVAVLIGAERTKSADPGYCLAFARGTSSGPLR